MSGTVVWFTGLPRSGKSTLASTTREALAHHGVPAIVLDGDRVRAMMQPPPGYDPTSRDAFYATLANLAGLLASQGFVVLVPATAHRRQYRDYARAVSPRFLEVHVDTPVESCAERDAEGLYRSSSTRSALPGAGIAYEAPARPDVVAHGGRDVLAVEHLLSLLIRYSDGGVSARASSR